MCGASPTRFIHFNQIGKDQTYAAQSTTNPKRQRGRNGIHVSIAGASG